VLVKYKHEEEGRLSFEGRRRILRPSRRVRRTRAAILDCRVAGWGRM
jgi:hypothetical protein